MVMSRGLLIPSFFFVSVVGAIVAVMVIYVVILVVVHEGPGKMNVRSMLVARRLKPIGADVRMAEAQGLSGEGRYQE
jgi:hypothetical protein